MTSGIQMQQTSTQRYNAQMIVIHWVMAALVICAAISAFVIDEMPNAAAKATLTNLHFVFGALVLALVAVRGLLRLTITVPALPENTHPHVAKAALVGHLGLYALMIGVPLIGVITAFYRGRGIDFGLFQITSPFEGNRTTGKFFKEIHELIAYGFFAAIGGHALFALWHHYILKDGLMDRMRFAKSGANQAE
jgi:cytochrome b561